PLAGLGAPCMGSALRVHVQKSQRTLPGQLGRSSVVNITTLLIEKPVLSIIAEQLVGYLGLLEGRFERIDRCRRAPIVLVCKVALPRHSEGFGVSGLGWGNTIEAHGGIEIGDLDAGND